MWVSTGTETMRSRCWILPVAGLILCILSAPAGAAIIEEIVAKVNNRIITKGEFEERGQMLVRQIYQRYFGEELDREIQAAQDGLLANLITENLLLERANGGEQQILADEAPGERVETA